MMPASRTFPCVSDDILSLSHRLPTALSALRAHQVHDRAAPITPSDLGRSVPTTAPWCVIEVSTPRRKPPEVSALSSAHGPYVRHVWRGPRGREPLGLVVYKPLYFVPKRISNRAHPSSPPPLLLSKPSSTTILLFLSSSSCSSGCHSRLPQLLYLSSSPRSCSLHLSLLLSQGRPPVLVVSLGRHIIPEVFMVVPLGFP